MNTIPGDGWQVGLIARHTDKLGWPVRGSF